MSARAMAGISFLIGTLTFAGFVDAWYHDLDQTLRVVILVVILLIFLACFDARFDRRDQ